MTQPAGKFDGGIIVPGVSSLMGPNSVPLDIVQTSDMQAAPTKATPVDADGFTTIDSEAGNAIKQTLWSSIKSTLKTYFDTLYVAVARALPSGGTTGQVLSKSSNADYAVSWTTVSSSGGTWGSITGTLSSQTDLQTALNAKVTSNGALGTPSSGVATNLTGTASGLTAGNVTTNANLTGHVTSVGNAAVLGSFSSTQLATALTDETGSGAAVFGTGPTLSQPTIDNFKLGYTTTATSAGTLTLTASSNNQQFFTGTTTHTVVLPVASTMGATGSRFILENNSTGVVTVNSSGGNLVVAIVPGASVKITCILLSGTTAASWDVEYVGFATVTGTGANVLATAPTFAGITSSADATVSVGAKLRLGGPSSKFATLQNQFGQDVTFAYSSGGQFFSGEAGVFGTNDIFFQGIPATTAGFTVLESSNSAGLCIGTSGNTNPILFKVNRVEVGRLTTSSMLVLGAAASSSHPAIKKSGTAIAVRLADDSADAALTSSTIRLGLFTVATLPSASANARAQAWVSDASVAYTSANIGSTVAGSGANTVPVYSDGTNWKIG